MGLSPAHRFALALKRLPPSKARALWREYRRREAALVFDWRWHARPEQLPPEGEWSSWLLRAGRGFGKTRTGAETVREYVGTGLVEHIALVGKTPADVRDVMIEGPAGLLSCYPEHERPEWIPSRRTLRFQNGARALVYSGENPDALRGPQHHLVWGDELEAYQYPRETLDNVMFGLRLSWRDGSRARAIWTTTPRKTKALRWLMAQASTVQTTGSTYDNADNLDPAALARLLEMYEGTRTGRQELHAEVLDDLEGALWLRKWIDEHRVSRAPDALVRIVVAVDPAATSNKDSAETGIVVAGVAADGHVFVLEDLSGRMTPAEWGARAVEAWARWGADACVIEVNQGGDMAIDVLRGASDAMPIRSVHAARGKLVRAEPASMLYQRGMVHHVGTFSVLEDQLCNYEGKPSDVSPDRMDALVWALFDLVIKEQTKAITIV